MERVPARRAAAGSTHVCVDFEPPIAVGTEYGTPAGQSSGTVVITTNGIAVSVADFEVGGNTVFNVASVDAAPPGLGTGQALRVNNISLDVDLSGLPFAAREVHVDYLDLGGTENLAVNGSAVFVGDIAAAPPTLGGVAVSVTASPVPAAPAARWCSPATSRRCGSADRSCGSTTSAPSGRPRPPTDGRKQDRTVLFRPIGCWVAAGRGRRPASARLAAMTSCRVRRPNPRSVTRKDLSS